MRRFRLSERRPFLRSRTVRELASAVRWIVRRPDTPDLAHLAFYEDATVGPVQADEALLLHALVRTVRPETVVELGFFRGDSSFNFLRALDLDARLYSFDIDPAAGERAAAKLGHDPRFAFRARGQETLTPADVDGRTVDFVFFDAAHDLDLNQRAFGRLLPLLSGDAILAVHDTGTLASRFLERPPNEHERAEHLVRDGYEHQPGERTFVNWLREEHPEFAQMHLHTHRYPRYGLTLLQRSKALPRPNAAGASATP
jgi:predicted O-methyltransferase YrrM